MLQEKFATEIRIHEKIKKKFDVVFDIVGYIKLFLLLLLVFSIYLTVSKSFSIEYIFVSFAVLIALVILWIYQENLYKKIGYSKGIIDINNKHIDRITGKWTAFSDIGEEFINTEHPYACDLDIVGRKSLFQFLNSTNTWYGRQTFANDLLQPKYSDDEIRKRQEAVFELSQDIKFANHIQYYLFKITAEASTVNLVNELKDNKVFIKNKAIKILLTYAPMLTSVFIAALVIFQLKSLYTIGAIIVLIQTIVWIMGNIKTQKYLYTMAHLPYRLNAYSEVIEILTNKEFSSEILCEIKSHLETAKQGIKDLGKIADKVSVKHNGIVWFILNVLLLWDYECAFALQDWKSKYAQIAEQWFLSLGEFESLLCFSKLANVCDNTILPIITERGKIVEGKEMGHPLLLNEIRVNNDFNLNDNIFIISGSNMSGKTTFLRTVGINLVLACAGSFVCANHMNFLPMPIMTSMRISDDLNEGVSTFYAELKRIKSIIELASKDTNMIFLIDEIFRGTNSVDRLNGARTVISKLNELSVIGIISTHDLELCELANQSGKIKNYSFSEQYKDKKICFDYKITQGKSNTTNAKYLMQMVGIID